MRVLLTGGGTAGHINPALAIAETIKQNDPHAVIEFVGIRTGKENDLVPREGYKLHYVESMGIRRSLSPANIKALWLALTSPYARATVDIIKTFKPDIVIGTGGYACWPIMAAAARLGIPTAVHESNALPGLAVKRLQGRVDRIWINFEKTRELLRADDRIVHVGNPLRRGFGAISREAARRQLGIPSRKKLILSFGGSLGAEAVNRAVIELMRTQVAGNGELMHVHAAGKRDFAASEELFKRARLKAYPNCFWVDYIYDMPLHMAAADLVIARAGAMTLSELALMKKSAVLIPSPYVADNHQYKNAKTLADAGAAVLVEESALPTGALTDAVVRLLADGRERGEMETRISAFADEKANERIWKEIVGLVKK
ncbi:MAG: UDP-N-acetylglucosamine--N-acetylmuramyl-(pentapeptide) pyrophosphoryl-undecaprenol N-acetylglucosamine transferase [Clostridia bacterium]|nr:UDP-N-acetylglucosamine--N-acetylmuramyl-(pentapeptide) pyrophosphoryl-undecaprenol N-acetylglucosamine transferase [Clostridia bacterium]